MCLFTPPHYVFNHRIQNEIDYKVNVPIIIFCFRISGHLRRQVSVVDHVNSNQVF